MTLRVPLIALDPPAMVLHGSGIMGIPEGGDSIREIEFRCQRLAERPIVCATVSSEKSAGVTFAVYNVTINQLRAQTQIAVSAQILHSPDAPQDSPRKAGSRLPIRCDVIVIGSPEARRRVQKKATSGARRHS